MKHTFESREIYKMSLLELASTYLAAKAAVSKLTAARKAFILKLGGIEPPGCIDVVAQFDVISKQYEFHKDDIVGTQDLKAMIAIMCLVTEFTAAKAIAEIYMNGMSDLSILLPPATK